MQKHIKKIINIINNRKSITSNFSGDDQSFDDYLSHFLAKHSEAIVIKPTDKKDNSNETFQCVFILTMPFLI